MHVLLAGGYLETHPGKAGWCKLRGSIRGVLGTGFAGHLKHSSHVHLLTGLWGGNSGLTDLSVQKLKCVVSG